MNRIKIDIFYSCLICIISCIFVTDIFLTPGTYAAFDTPFHMTNMAQFYLALKSGDFPVTWADGFANYGLPIPIVAHQLTSYLGAGLLFLTHNPVISFNILAFIGIFFSSLFFYWFLRIYAPPLLSFFGTFLFTFTPYRVINFYVRGALPEVFSQMFLPLILMSTYFLIKEKKIWGFYLLICSFFLLSLNHPMMLLIYAFIYLPYFLYMVFVDEGKISLSLKRIREQKTGILLFCFGAFIGVGLASYYLIPLNQEIKYFYYGQTNNHLTPDSYLSWENFFFFRWPYFTTHEIFTRGHIIQTGILESIALLVGIIILTGKLARKKLSKSFTILEFAVLTGCIIILFTLPVTNVLYTHINILSNIQFPWRVLSAFLFVPPIICVVLLKKAPPSLLLGLVLFISLTIFPQIYGKNYILSSNALYYFNPVNAHSVLMNTIWSGKSEEYPIERGKVGIIAGKGTILSREIKNSSRTYVVSGTTDLKLVDYTFYFPGWKVTVDNKPVPIEFQDPAYRGVITYAVPSGKHTVRLMFTDTRVRHISKLLSGLFFFLVVVLLLSKRKILTILKSYA